MKKLENIHPGEILKEEFLDPMEITAYRLSKETFIPRSPNALDLLVAPNRTIPRPPNQKYALFHPQAKKLNSRPIPQIFF